MDAFHLNLSLAAQLTPEIYEAVALRANPSTGEWLFSAAAFGEEATPGDESYFSAFPAESNWGERFGKTSSWLSDLRHRLLPRFVQECLESVDWGKYRVVGFTSAVQQNAASLALARGIKERYPQVTIVFGGANMDGEMGPEHARAFPFLDYVVVGEGDLVFPELVRRLARGERPEAAPGLVVRGPEGVVSGGVAPLVRDLDSLPTPNYDEYFERATALGLLQSPLYSCSLPFESSRGCWWGEKRQCTFCSFNRSGIAYRKKSAGKVLEELSQLAQKHRVTSFDAADNMMDLGYLVDLFPAVAAARMDYQLFYHTTPNLTRPQVGTMYRGGMRWIQPGIESFSTRVLGLMNKATTMLHNVRLLKWCLYFGVRVEWKLLWGFPDERKEDYQEELQVLKLLSHLEPPTGWGRVMLERWSPYFRDPKGPAFPEVRPASWYRHVYPTSVDLEKVAYRFDYTPDGTLPEEPHAETIAWAEEWRQRWFSDRPDSLFYHKTPGSLFVEDNRGPDRQGAYSFAGAAAAIYEFCGETMRTVRQVVDHLETLPGQDRVGESEVRTYLKEMCGLGLMLAEDGQHLSLALPANPCW